MDIDITGFNTFGTADVYAIAVTRIRIEYPSAYGYAVSDLHGLHEQVLAHHHRPQAVPRTHPPVALADCAQSPPPPPPPRAPVLARRGPVRAASRAARPYRARHRTWARRASLGPTT